MNEAVDLRSKFCGAMVGTGLGDAIGELAFRWPSKEALLATVACRRELSYTDDTAMALGLAESIDEVGGVDRQHLGDTFRRNYWREPWRGYASGPPTVFSRVEQEGMSYVDAAWALYGGEGSFGNGAAMRIAPVGLYFWSAPDLYEQALLSATVTHAHPIGVDGAALQARAVAQAVALDPRNPFPTERFLTALRDTARTPEMRQKMSLVGRLLEDETSPPTAARALGQGVAVQRSQPFALYSFLRHSDSFEETLFCAVLHGGDRDTMGAMACAVSGAYLGCRAIPAAWHETLENRHRLEQLGARLAEKA